MENFNDSLPRMDNPKKKLEKLNKLLNIRDLLQSKINSRIYITYRYSAINIQMIKIKLQQLNQRIL